MTAQIDLDYPFTGRWLVQNSPANRVPSHGTTLFASSHAIDFVPVGDSRRRAQLTWNTWRGREPAAAFPGFGRRVLAPCDGRVIAVERAIPDHQAHRALASVGYALGQRARVRAGWPGLAGNHVMIEHDGIIVALCHLMQDSVKVEVGQHLAPGQPVGRCGNTGNSTEPHLHLQAMDGPQPGRAAPVPITFHGQLPHNRQILDL
ncbi:Peptidase [Glutamicibacter creatinolyticus]|uniref:Peptidase n=1 Tax=Glutamicibacter creatinolyticus TaxID=162496 RepID=A0A5B7WQD1_9MICC|nr:M23 family metallopeptidase [Glutamicibacter creatinolyticus]QCY46152.1 Peptidase [Glutamicibacter creatinolyticus]